MSTSLIVIGHPDDECFMGASIAKFVSEGHQVYVGALADGETSRIGAIADAVMTRQQKQDAAAQVLGCQVLEGPSCLDQRLDARELLDLTQMVEAWIWQVKPSVVYTHSPHDLNADHRRVYEAVLPAVRPKSGVQAVYCFEGPRMLQFTPTSFVAVTEAHLKQQQEALRCYGDELSGGEWELIKARAVECGYHVGVPYAEGFEVVRECR